MPLFSFPDNLVLVPSTAVWPVIPNFPRSVASCLPSRSPRCCHVPEAACFPLRQSSYLGGSVASRPGHPVSSAFPQPPLPPLPKSCSLPTMPVIAAFSCFPISHPQWSRRSLSLRLPSTAARPSRSPRCLHFPAAARFPHCASHHTSQRSVAPPLSKSCSLPTVPVIAVFSCFPITLY